MVGPRVGFDLGSTASRVATAEGVERTSEPGFHWPPDGSTQGHLRDLVVAGLGDIRADAGIVCAVPAGALRTHRQQLRESFHGLAHSVLLVPQPFAAAYGLGLFDDTLVVDIGARTTDVCRLRGHYPKPEDQRSLEWAGDWIDQRLARSLERRIGFPLSKEEARHCKEAGARLDSDRGIHQFLDGVNHLAPGIDVAEEVRWACESILPPILEAIADLISEQPPQPRLGQPVELLLTGGGASIPGLAQRLRPALRSLGKLRVRRPRDPFTCTARGALRIASDLAHEHWRELALN